MLRYALISANDRPVVEHCDQATTRPAAIVESVLTKIATEPRLIDSRKSYSYQALQLHHLLGADDCIYLCMTDATFSRRVAFGFLAQLRQEYQDSLVGVSLFTQDRLINLMETYSAPQNDQTRLIQNEISHVQDVMSQNINKILERGERIEVLVDKTDNLNLAAFRFKKRSTVLKRKMWWLNMRLWIILSMVCVLVTYLIVCAACGFPSWEQCLVN